MINSTEPMISDEVRLVIFATVEPNEILPELRIRNSITELEYESFQHQMSRKHRVIRLLDIIERKRLSLKVFADVLRASNYTDLANTLYAKVAPVDPELSPASPPQQPTPPTVPQAPVLPPAIPQQPQNPQAVTQLPQGHLGHHNGSPPQQPGAAVAPPTQPPNAPQVMSQQPQRATTPALAQGVSPVNPRPPPVPPVAQAVGGRAEAAPQPERVSPPQAIGVFDIVRKFVKARIMPITPPDAIQGRNALRSEAGEQRNRNNTPTPAKQQVDLTQFVKTGTAGLPCVYLPKEDLSKCSGTETFPSDYATKIDYWVYAGNGENLQKFFSIISNNPSISEKFSIRITDEVINERSQFPQLPMLRWMTLYIKCQLSRNSVEKLASILSALKPTLPNLLSFRIDSDGYSIPSMGSLFQHIPQSVDRLGFWDVTLSERDIDAVRETFENRPSLDLIEVGPTDSTVDSFVDLVRKLRNCPSIEYLSLNPMRLNPENTEKFLAEVKMWDGLKYLWLSVGEVDEGGQFQLENIVHSLPNLKEVQLWPAYFSLPRKSDLRKACEKRNVKYVEK